MQKIRPQIKPKSEGRCKGQKGRCRKSNQNLKVDVEALAKDTCGLKGAVFNVLHSYLLHFLCFYYSVCRREEKSKQKTEKEISFKKIVFDLTFGNES